MSMTEWAEREVDIACKRENSNSKEGEWDYGCACYQSALKAYKSLMEDNHSGFSFNMTRQILEKLMRNQPLTPIEDTDDIWDDYTYGRKNGVKTYQCIRRSSLFKDVYPDGTVSYHDVDRFDKVCVCNPNSVWHSNLIDRICGDIYPITMPYVPENKNYKVYCDDFLVDPKNGDFDTIGIIYVIEPDGSKKDICRYFKSGDAKCGWVEINEDEYLDRKERSIK